MTRDSYNRSPDAGAAWDEISPERPGSLETTPYNIAAMLLRQHGHRNVDDILTLLDEAGMLRWPRTAATEPVFGPSNPTTSASGNYSPAQPPTILVAPYGASQ